MKLYLPLLAERFARQQLRARAKVVRHEEWIVDDPAGLPVAGVRPIRDDIGRRVIDLLAGLDLAVTS